MEFKTADIVRRLNQTRTNRVLTSVELLAINDRLLGSALEIVTRDPEGLLNRAVLDYMLDKQRKVKASVWRLRYGRDYMTGRPRHVRQRNTWRDQGYDDAAAGRPIYRKPEEWSGRRWRIYCAGAEMAQVDGVVRRG